MGIGSLCREIPNRQLENEILDLNKNGYTVLRSKANGDKIQLFYEKNFPIELSRVNLSCLEEEENVIHEKVHRTSFGKVFNILIKPLNWFL